MAYDRAQCFDQLYAANIDPWGFRSATYERDKYAATLDILPRSRYRLAIEAGCSIGELTRMLASRCKRVIGIDVSAVALKEAARRNADLETVSFLHGELPAIWPSVQPDLIILSEILYFLSAQEVRELVARIETTWRVGHCVLVNYLGSVSCPLQGGVAADVFVSSCRRARHISRTTEERYQIDLLAVPES